MTVRGGGSGGDRPMTARRVFSVPSLDELPLEGEATPTPLQRLLVERLVSLLRRGPPLDTFRYRDKKKTTTNCQGGERFD